MNNNQIEHGTVSAVHGRHIFIDSDTYGNVFCMRERLRPSAQFPYIGMRVAFEPNLTVPGMRDVCANWVEAA